METRVAVISIIVENTDAVEPLNGLCIPMENTSSDGWVFPIVKRHQHYLRGAGCSPLTKINALSGALGRLNGISTKVGLFQGLKEV